MEGKPNMALIYLISHVECRESVFDEQINEENSKAALGMDICFAEINDKYGCIEPRYPQTMWKKFKVRLS